MRTVFRQFGSWLRESKSLRILVWIVLISVPSYYWWRFSGHDEPHRTVLLAALSLSAFAVGCILGFLFTSFGEEQSTLGKIRDWLIAGIAGIGVTEAIEQGGQFKKILEKFQFGQSQGEFGLVISMAIVYATLGFFFMFFQRELILNTLLAARRAERARLEGAQQTGLVIQKISTLLPATVLSGVDDIEEILENQDEGSRLKSILYSSDVENFLHQADEAVRQGMPLDWDVISKVAYVHYYRTYFEPKEKQQKSVQVKKALEWIRRALTLNPMHVDLTTKLADMLGTDKQYAAAVAVLEQLDLRQDAPFFVKQWLGYFFLYIPARVDKGINYSQDFLKLFPNHPETLINLASGYAQLYCEDLRHQRKDPKNYDCALDYLKLFFSVCNSPYPPWVLALPTKLTQPGESFDCFKDDERFNEIVKSFTAKAKMNPYWMPRPSKPSTRVNSWGAFAPHDQITPMPFPEYSGESPAHPLPQFLQHSVTP